MIPFFIVAVVFLIGAVFDVNWIMKLTKADRRYGRKFARICNGMFGFMRIIAMIIMLINS